jgi:hypothetical protein
LPDAVEELLLELDTLRLLELLVRLGSELCRRRHVFSPSSTIAKKVFRGTTNTDPSFCTSDPTPLPARVSGRCLYT